MTRQDQPFGELERSILDGTIQVFNQKGIKFTMDDIARQLGMSKKTIYKVFRDKEQLFLAMVDYLFDGIKESENQVINDDTLTTFEKIQKILGVMPDGYKDVDFTKLYMLKDRYPMIYKQVEQRLETGWEQTISLIQQGIDEGVVRNVNISIVKMMMEASIEQFFQRDLLIQGGLTYQDALQEVVEILMHGIKA